MQPVSSSEYLRLDAISKKRTKRFSLAGHKGLAFCEHVYDGDTPHLTFFAMGMDRPFRWTCRMARIQAPEMRGRGFDEKALAIECRDFLADAIHRRFVWIEIGSMGKYGRPVVEIWNIVNDDCVCDASDGSLSLVKGGNVNDKMMDSGGCVLYNSQLPWR